jgi:flagellar hook-associated protein 2
LVQDVSSTLSGLGELGRTRSLSLSSSNANKVSVVNNGISSPAVYTITDITSVAKAASETTAAGLATADATAVDSGDNSVELVVGSETFALDLTSYGNHLEGLRDAINASAADVTATVLNTGSNYYLSVTSSSTGARQLQLRTEAGNAGTNLLTGTNQGANAVFKFNGLAVEQSDNVVSTVVPGLTFTILDTTEEDESVTLTASSSRGDIATKLSALVQTYNAARDGLRTQIGENAGILSGDYLVGEVSRALRAVAGYNDQSGRSVQSLADLGIELDKAGVMSFSSTKFYALGSAAIEDAFTFLGSESTGLGGLSERLNQLSDPVTGFIRTQQNNYDSADLRIEKQVAELVGRIERLQLSMSSKLQQADALLAGLKSQQNALDASLKSVNFALYGKTG